MFHVASRFDPDGQIHEFVDLTTPADKEPFIFAKLPLKLYEKSVPPRTHSVLYHGGTGIPLGGGHGERVPFSRRFVDGECVRLNQRRTILIL